MHGYSEDDEVLVKYPLTGDQERGDRAAWPWLPGTVTEVCGPDEWQVAVDDQRVATEQDGELWYPLVFRDGSELRPAGEAS